MTGLRRTLVILAVSTVLGAGATLLNVDLRAAATPSGTVVPLKQVYRACDFTPAVNVDARGHGTGQAVFHPAAAHTITAEVRLLGAEPQMRYNVRLIQAPRSSVSCGAADTRVVSGTLGTDDVGSATAILTADTAAQTTGAWIFVDRPAEHSQTPAEFYTSDFIAAV